MNAQLALIIIAASGILTGCQGTKSKGTAALVKGAPPSPVVSKTAEEKTVKRPPPSDVANAGTGNLNERAVQPTSTAKVEQTTRAVTVAKSPEKTSPPPSPSYVVPEPRVEKTTERTVETTTIIADDNEIRGGKK